MNGELLLKGLTVAGANTTWSGFIKDLRAVTNWKGDGLAAVPVNVSKELKKLTDPPASNGAAFGRCRFMATDIEF